MVFWGSSFALVKVAVETIPPWTQTASRVVLAALLLLVFVRIRGESLPAPTSRDGRITWLHFLAIGLLGNGIPFTLIAWGEQRIDSSLAAILIGVMPVFTLCLAALFRIERVLNPLRIAGIGTGLAGLVMLVGPAGLPGLGGHGLAELAIAGAALSYAGLAVYARVLSLRLPVATLSAGAMIASAMVLVPLALIIDRPWTLAPSAEAIACVLGLAIFATGLASLVYFRLLATAGPTFASTVNYLIPLFGMGLGVAWLGESVSLREIFAMLLILSGVALVRPGVRLRNG